MCELAWAAGFFDGEGCTYATNRNLSNRKRYPKVVIHQVDRRALDRFRAAVGSGKVLGPYKAPSRGGSPIHELSYQGRRAIAVLSLLWPFLGEAKREQALRVGESLAGRTAA